MHFSLYLNILVCKKMKVLHLKLFVNNCELKKHDKTIMKARDKGEHLI